AALQRRAFWWAGLFAGLAIMTRYTGAFLVFPLLVALWQARAVWWRYLSAALAPLLMGAFWLYFILRFHVLPTTAISHEWHSMFAWPWTGIVRSIAYLTADGNMQSTVQTTARDLLLTLVLLALAVGVWRLRLPLGFKVYAASFVLFVLADPVFFADHSDPLWAVPRYLLPIFPLFIPLAQWSLRSKGAQLALVAVTLTVSTYLLVGFSVGGMLA
ncbi:MAG TPA: hypothetical protein VIG30_14785, partial [Ktedonobacterales bacterium]